MTPGARSVVMRLQAMQPLLPALLFLLILLVLPVSQLLALSFFSKQGVPSLEHYTRLFSSSIYVQVLWITIKIAALTTLGAVVIAYPIAFVIATSADRVKTWLYFLVLIPFWTSFLVRAFAWMVLLGRNGTVNKLAVWLGLVDQPMALIYNLFGALIGTTHALLPMAVIIMVSVMEGIDRNLSKAALTMGAGPGSAFWRVFFPLSLPGVASATLLVFLTALGFFITPALLGGRREVVITQVIIEQVQEFLNWPFGGAVSVLLLVSTAIVYLLYDRIAGISALGAAAQIARPARAKGAVGSLLTGLGIATLTLLGRATDVVLARLAGLRTARQAAQDETSIFWKLPCALGLFFLCGPALILIPVSFTTRPIMDWPPVGFTLDWYRQFFDSPQWIAATIVSFTVGLLSALLTMAIAIPAAFVLVRRSVFGRKLVTALFLAPMAVPRIIIAIALFYFYARVGLVGSITGLVLGHSVLALPYALIGVMTVLRGYDERLDQAALILGAGKRQAFLRITLPLIRFGILSAFLLSFITSFDDLTVSLFITTGLTTTLPKQMWENATMQITPTLAAVSTLIILFMLVVIGVIEWLRRRQSVAA